MCGGEESCGILGLPGVPILPEFQGVSPSNFVRWTNFRLTRVVLRRKILCLGCSNHTSQHSISTEQATVQQKVE